MASLRRIDFRLWFAIILMALMPALYSTARIYFLNTLPDTWSVSIAAQAAWLHLAYEVAQEALLLPLYYVFGTVIADRAALRGRVGDAFLIALIAYGLLTLAILTGADWLTRAMAQQPHLQAQTAEYLRLEALALMIGVLNDICVIVVVALSWRRILFALVALRAALSVIFDSAFVGQFDFSLNLGVRGVALTNIAVGALLLVPSIAILARAGALSAPRFIRQARKNRPEKEQQKRRGESPEKRREKRWRAGWAKRWATEWKKDWLRVAARSGMESAVRNLAFSLMILRLVNELDQAALFWVTNHFIWVWLLLPVLSLGTLIRQDTGNHLGRLDGRLAGYFWLIAIIIGLWAATLPGWHWFITHAMGSSEAEKVVSLTLLLVGFYVIFSLNHVLDSYLYGMGRTDLVLRQSVIVNAAYYGAAFLAYRTGHFAPDLSGIALLFGGGIVLDSAVTLAQFWRAGYFKRSAEAHPKLPSNDPAPGSPVRRENP